VEALKTFLNQAMPPIEDDEITCLIFGQNGERSGEHIAPAMRACCPILRHG
jgi:hypothetical protein